MKHVVLFGDSVFDNGAYAGAEGAVAVQLGKILPAWQVSVRALDGSVAAGVLRQMEEMPKGASHLVVSAGGNDALRQAAVLQEPAHSIASALVRLNQVRDLFAGDYRRMLDALEGHGLPTAVCTIYDARVGDRGYQDLARAGLVHFNDVITREAFARSLALIDLRLVCNEDADFVNQIEPSAKGARKIAGAIATLVRMRHDKRAGSRVIAR